jgi:branched-chain amino acid transport system substrate-binding protein
MKGAVYPVSTHLGFSIQSLGGQNMKKAIMIGILVVSLSMFGTSLYAQEIKIGWVGALSGPPADEGVNMKNGAVLAVEEINSSGGVLGRKFSLIIEDDASVPVQSVNAVQKLIERDKVVAVIGSLTSSATLASMEVTQRAQVAQITPNAIADKITEMGNPFIFRNINRVEAVGSRYINYFSKKLNIKRFAILYEATDYGKSTRDINSKAIKSNGAELVAEETYKPGTTDFYSLLTKIKAMNPEMLICVAIGPSAVQIARQIQEIGWKIKTFGYAPFSMPQFLEQAGKAAELIMATAWFYPLSEESIVTKFTKSYRERYGRLPDFQGAAAYDTVYIIAEAIKRANSLDPIKIRDAIRSIKDLPGVQGTTAFDEKGDVLWKNVYLIQIQDQGFKYITRFEKDKDIELVKIK